MMKRMFAAVAFALAVSGSVLADATPVEVSLLPGLALPPGFSDVNGVRFNLIAGDNLSVAFLDAGFVSCLVEDAAYGLQASGFYGRVGKGAGLVQVAGFVSRCDREFTGLQVSGLYNSCRTDFFGAGFSLMNFAEWLHGAQVGIFNRVNKLTGVQIGLVNYADDSDEGVQIGLVNVMPNGRFPVCPVINVGF